MPKIRTGILAATGAVGQRFVQLLENHPWFEITAVAASDNSVGKRYQDAARWFVSPDMPAAVRDMIVLPCEPGMDCDLVFSALPSDVAGPIEEAFAAAGHVVSSNANNHRLDPDVPLLIPEVNPSHLGLIPIQQRRRGWDTGYIITNGNCSTIHLVLALKPLQDAFGLKKVLVTTMQALSGAGYPGVPALDILDNVIPYIGGEEKKLETEPLKMLGRFNGEQVINADIVISAHCNRVATRDGHLEAVSVELDQKPTLDEIIRAFREFKGEPQALGLPSAPAHPIIVRDEPDRPQPRFDRDAEKGMASVIGRVREDPILGYKFLVLGHNTVRGAAGSAILNAELLVAKGYLSLDPAKVKAQTRTALHLPAYVAQEIIAHAREGAPKEVCGVLAGHNGAITQIYRAGNAAENPIVTYNMDPRDQLRILQDIDAHGWDIFGIYHSHPASPAYPSPTDVAQAYYNSYYLIVSLAQKEPIIRAFKISTDNGQITEYPVVVE